VDALALELERRRRRQLYRRRRVADGPAGPERLIDGRRMLAFCSNDYLGLAAERRVVEAFQAGAARFGIGAGAAHLIDGHTGAHHALEEELAEWTGRARALLFSTGYMANLGAIAGLLGRGDRVFEDRLNHASLLDAGPLSRAKMRRYRHCDIVHLRELLGQAPSSARCLVATDGVFSMDGDHARLTELADAAGDCHAWLMVDDAHGLGVLGPQGAGTCALYGLGSDRIQILVGTLGKALGTFGAFVAGSEELIETLIQKARPYIYTTAPPPAIAEATRVSLRIARSEEWRRERLRKLVRRFRRGAQGLGLCLGDSETPIQPVILGSVERAMHWAGFLERQGLLVPAIRPPTVAEGSARLRITFSALHSDLHLERLLDSLQTLSRESSECA